MSLPALSFSICSCSICFNRFMAISPAAAPRTGRSGGRVKWGWASFYWKVLGLSPVRFGGLSASPEVRPTLLGELLSLCPPPSRDLAVIAGQQYVRDRLVLPELGPRVLGVFQQPLREAFLRARSLFAHDARQEPDAGVDQRHRGDFAPREHEIAERDLLQAPAFDQALVHTLEPAAHDDHARAATEFRNPRLRQRLATRRHQETRPALAGCI